jgi:ABC-type nitrate/sulfonate/bicarbonate transport system permease component
MRYRRAALVLLVMVGTLLVLQWGVPALGIAEFILPRPTSVAARLFDPQSNLLFHLGITALESGGGFVVGSILGFGLAVVFVHVRPLEDAFYPWVIVLQTVPLVAIAPLMIIWFGNGMVSRIIMSALFTFFPVLVNSVRGLRQAAPATLDLLQSYAISPWQRFWVLRLPNSLPFLFAGLKIGSTLAVAGAIVAEFEGAGQGLGFVITISTYHLATDQTFAAVVVASLLGILFYGTLVLLERRLVFWKETM